MLCPLTRRGQCNSLIHNISVYEMFVKECSQNMGQRWYRTCYSGQVASKLFPTFTAHIFVKWPHLHGSTDPYDKIHIRC